ncbi:MAG: hypothetical protein LBB18_03385 [Puniceicoccales bacterium]|jgi:hypothetical protein|nr:hypothetical protein [Puniceicoccales bacterium]
MSGVRMNGEGKSLEVSEELSKLSSTPKPKPRWMVYGAPSINPEKLQQSWKDYDIKALEPMVEWIRSAKPRNGEMFQYDEVHGKLNEFNPPCCHEYTFVKELLLPELFKRKVENIPLDILAILYTISLSDGERKFLGANLDIDPKTGLGSENLFLQFKYENPEQLFRYRVRNFQQPEIAELENIK